MARPVSHWRQWSYIYDCKKGKKHLRPNRQTYATQILATILIAWDLTLKQVFKKYFLKGQKFRFNKIKYW